MLLRRISFFVKIFPILFSLPVRAKSGTCCYSISLVPDFAQSFSPLLSYIYSMSMLRKTFLLLLLFVGAKPVSANGYLGPMWGISIGNNERTPLNDLPLSFRHYFYSSYELQRLNYDYAIVHPFVVNPSSNMYFMFPVNNSVIQFDEFHLRPGAVFCRMENYTQQNYRFMFSIHTGGFRESDELY